MTAPIPSNEEERLKELLEYQILDTGYESAYDELSQLASIICKTPVALVSLVDQDRQWFKAKIGVVDSELPRDTSFCGHAIHEKEILIVSDSRLDLRFYNNPYVEAGLVRFYAGVPLMTPNGYSLGTLCVSDVKPRELSTDQIETLKILARQVVRNLELHRSLMKLKDKYSEVMYLSKIVTSQKAQLIESAKFVAIGTLAAGMAHEINNPLAVIHGIHRQLTVLLQRDFDKEKMVRLMGPMDVMVQRIASITRGMLEYAGDCGEEAFCTLNISEVIDKSLAMCRERLIRSQIKVIAPEPDGLCIEGRSLQITQILIHLINNARDAIQNAEEKWIKLEVQEGDDRVYLAVVDSGSGVPAEIAERIMEPFFTTKPVCGGTGLGLSIAKGMAETHHGNLYLDTSAPHTRFVLELPKAQRSTAPGDCAGPVESMH